MLAGVMAGSPKPEATTPLTAAYAAAPPVRAPAAKQQAVALPSPPKAKSKRRGRKGPNEGCTVGTDRDKRVVRSRRRKHCSPRRAVPSVSLRAGRCVRGETGLPLRVADAAGAADDAALLRGVSAGLRLRLRGHGRRGEGGREGAARGVFSIGLGHRHSVLDDGCRHRSRPAGGGSPRADLRRRRLAQVRPPSQPQPHRHCRSGADSLV